MLKRAKGERCIIWHWIDCFRGYVGCPILTDPIECEASREAFEAENPHLRLDLNFIYLYFSDFRTYDESVQHCSSLIGYHLATLLEVNALKAEIQASLQGCSMILWSIDNGVPVVVIVPPAGETRIYSGVSEFCRANTICIGPVE